MSRCDFEDLAECRNEINRGSRRGCKAGVPHVAQRLGSVRVADGRTTWLRAAARRTGRSQDRFGPPARVRKVPHMHGARIDRVGRHIDPITGIRKHLALIDRIGWDKGRARRHGRRPAGTEARRLDESRARNARRARAHGRGRCLARRKRKPDQGRDCAPSVLSHAWLHGLAASDGPVIGSGLETWDQLSVSWLSQDGSG